MKFHQLRKLFNRDSNLRHRVTDDIESIVTSIDEITHSKPTSRDSTGKWKSSYTIIKNSHLLKKCENFGSIFGATQRNIIPIQCGSKENMKECRQTFLKNGNYYQY